MYSKQDAERNRIESVRMERAVHSPAEKFSSKKSNNPGEGPGTSRGKYAVKSSHMKKESKSKSNTAKIASMQKNQHRQQPDLDNANNYIKNNNFQVR